MRILTSVSVALGATVLLAGCTFDANANFTVSASSLADEAAAALHEQVGAPQPPHLDCGSGQVDMVVDKSIPCELTVEGDDAVYDATIVITEVDGRDYSFEVNVAEQPR